MRKWKSKIKKFPKNYLKKNKIRTLLKPQKKTFKAIIPQLSQQPAMGLGQNIFVDPLRQCIMPCELFLNQPWAGRVRSMGQKNIALSIYLSCLTWDWVFLCVPPYFKACRLGCFHPLASRTFFSDLLTTHTHTICRGALRFATQILPLLNYITIMKVGL